MRISTIGKCEREFKRICNHTGTRTGDGKWSLSVGGTSISTGELGRTLLSKDTAQTERDSAWATIVDQARKAQEPWLIIAVGVAIPGIRNAIKFASVYAPEYSDRTEIESAALAGFVTAVHDIDTTRGKVCARLCNRAYIAARRCAIEISRYQRQLHSPIFESHPPAKEFGHPDLVLAKAIDNEIVTRLQAILILKVVIEKLPISAVAEAEEITEESASNQIRAAKAQLWEWLTQ
ncbi:hypothetical protein SAMN05216298_0407 [Glycomyces sambucus]|uniref:Uncharacterized protein n=1 Tax=Glycomyces sambucus TaxID=380244 RepID=A0A1G9CLY3_9ACTN|nr:hypothetical protein [Glycomyces sambucus]SDK52596.1 hypothetical protein SAMN05216298_0407 [Glycomyces sambucus]